jgi:anti-sigma B factor antagonist
VAVLPSDEEIAGWRRPPSERFLVQRYAGGVSRICVRGELDLSDAPELGRLLEAERAAGHDLVVDLRELTFIDSSGLAVLVWAAQSAARAGRGLRLLPPAGAAMRTFEVTGLRELLPFEEV